MVSGYKKQLVETRENLEQMEGFQNQELSKVKHMLLNAGILNVTDKIIFQTFLSMNKFGGKLHESSDSEHTMRCAETVAETEKSLRSKLSEELDELQKQYDHLLNATSDVPIRNDQSIQTLHHQSEVSKVHRLGHYQFHVCITTI